jgi:DNA-binding GntR family transcriptional regulator
VGTALPPLHLDRSDPSPLYARVARHIEQAVADGVLKAGDRLDGEIGLAERLGVSRQTMRKAIEELVNRGILVRQHGVGTQVAPSRSGSTSGVSSLYDELTQAGKEPATQVRHLEVVPAEEDIAAALELGRGEEVVHLERLRLDGGSPLAIMRNWLPVNLVNLDRAELEKRGLYQILRDAGVDMRIAHQSIGAESASAQFAALLDVPEGTALLSMHTVTYAGLGRPVEVGRHTYRSDNFRFHITNVER